MDILSYAIQFWEVTLVAFVVILEIFARAFDRHKKTKHKFKFETMPAMRPIRIPTSGRGALSALWVWMLKLRKWELVEDFYYTIDDVDYVVPAGFYFDAASIPKFLHRLLSPTGILLVGSLIHDYGYVYKKLCLVSGEHTDEISRKHADKLFRDINIQVNGFNTLNRILYYMLRLFGIFAWNKLRKFNNQ